MYHGIHIGTHAVNGEVHHDFAGGILRAAQLCAIKIHYNHVLWHHHAFTDAGGSDQYAPLIEPDREIAVSSGDKAVSMEHLAKTHKIMAETALSGCRFTCNQLF